MASIEIDGQRLEATNGEMIIEVADKAGIYIPRFCYHKKLSIAANCRMCLVEVENGRKPVPACATPITNGMKIFTKSEQALRSQEAVMEFLLINHPLDCPICDQGGECELQDISMGFGYDSSEYQENKRAVEDDNLGPLIATDMTRCIHCTRCVRFGEEIAGLRELGMVNRGENAEITTYIKHSLTSEVSANIIDLCPVGALTSKPARYQARPWEVTRHLGIALHDCLGSNIYLYTRRDEFIRVTPCENEAINEVWLSDRDRFSYLGMKSDKRAAKPLIKVEGQWQKVEWPQALKFAAEGIAKTIKQHGAKQFAAFAGASSTLEEFYLLQKLMRGLGVNNLDHRLQQTDFRDQTGQTIMPQSSLAYQALDKQDTILIIGSNVHKEVPLIGIKIRKAYRNGAEIMAINPVAYDYRFKLENQQIVSPLEIPLELAKLTAALIEDKQTLPEAAQKLLIGLEVAPIFYEMAKRLKKPQAAIVLGILAENHPQAALIRTLVHLIETKIGVKVLRLTQGANSAGGHLAGMIPHRQAFGKSLETQGMDVQAALQAKLKGYLLFNAEPGYDFANPQLARQSLLRAEFVVLLSAFHHQSMQDYADVILPVAPYFETSGTYINIDKTWQTVKGVQAPFEQARPAWKIFRVLGNLLEISGFDYESSEQVLTEIKNLEAQSIEKEFLPYYPLTLPFVSQQLTRLAEWPLYRVDAIVRHAQALQKCAASQSPCIRLHPQTADRLKLGETATVSQGDIKLTLMLKRDESVALDTVWVDNAWSETVDLGESFATITIER